MSDNNAVDNLLGGNQTINPFTGPIKTSYNKRTTMSKSLNKHEESLTTKIREDKQKLSSPDQLRNLYKEYNELVKSLGGTVLLLCKHVYGLSLDELEIGLSGDSTITQGGVSLPAQVIFNPYLTNPFGYTRITISDDTRSIIKQPLEIKISNDSDILNLYNKMIEAGLSHDKACNDYYRNGNAAVSGASYTTSGEGVIVADTRTHKFRMGMAAQSEITRTGLSNFIRAKTIHGDNNVYLDMAAHVIIKTLAGYPNNVFEKYIGKGSVTLSVSADGDLSINTGDDRCFTVKQSELIGDCFLSIINGGSITKDDCGYEFVRIISTLRDMMSTNIVAENVADAKSSLREDILEGLEDKRLIDNLDITGGEIVEILNNVDKVNIPISIGDDNIIICKDNGTGWEMASIKYGTNQGMLVSTDKSVLDALTNQLQFTPDRGDTVTAGMLLIAEALKVLDEIDVAWKLRQPDSGTYVKTPIDEIDIGWLIENVSNKLLFEDWTIFLDYTVHGFLGKLSQTKHGIFSTVIGGEAIVFKVVDDKVLITFKRHMAFCLSGDRTVGDAFVDLINASDDRTLVDDAANVCKAIYHFENPHSKE